MRQKNLKDVDNMTQPKLTPEQQKVYDRWMQERSERQKILNEFFDSPDQCYQGLMEKLRGIDKDFCEHGRSTMGTCWSCEEIERIMFPELFEDEEND